MARAHISDLKPLPKNAFKKILTDGGVNSEEEIDTLANVGITLLYFQLEFMINDSAGNFGEALQKVIEM